MIKVYENIYVGGARAKGLLKISEYSLVCVSSKIHYQLHGWTKGFSYQNNPCYLTCPKDGFLSVNWVDAAARFYNWQGKGVATFIEVLDFIDEELKKGKKMYIYCDQGISRSPSVALLYLAKRLHIIPDTSFEEARENFLLLYPMYSPGGIADFIKENWEVIK